LLQIANAWDRIDAALRMRRHEEPARATAVPKLIQRNVGLPVARNCIWDCHPAVIPRHRPVNDQAGGEELMTTAEQAFLLTGELFVLSFVAIFAIWFADKLRRGFTGKP